ncbi:MAG TPA: hypothetical protein VF615_06430 [Longimicrobiaceae bacterium]|jgi:hypothetical protein
MTNLIRYAVGSVKVETPLGFFTLALVLLVSVHGWLAVWSEANRVMLVAIIVGSTASLTALVALLAVRRPEALWGFRPSGDAVSSHTPRSSR